ncbi:MAG: polyprenyl synthetase family protein [Clostridia bacterium]|nr:polyprenyl synthetase family protein [Clostridia bacterium]
MFNAVLDEYILNIETRLDMLTVLSDQPYDEVLKAARYSLLAGGKRIRPVILLEFYKLCGSKDNCAYNFACAIEMIHTYSLIHDDLPSMDNDDFRRGLPSCHKAFGEGMALLAGDDLLTEAFSVCAKTLGLPADRVLRALAYLSNSIGTTGMIGGQVIDTACEISDSKLLFKMFSLKTCALIRAAAVCGVILAGGDDEKISLAESYAENLGLAFQIIDDLLDYKGDSLVLGKPTGSDEKNKKITAVTLLGEEKCYELANRYTNGALEALDGFSGDTSFLKWLTQTLLKRDR